MCHPMVDSVTLVVTPQVGCGVALVRKTTAWISIPSWYMHRATVSPKAIHFLVSGVNSALEFVRSSFID